MTRNQFLLPLILFCLTCWLTVSGHYSEAFLCFFIMFALIFGMAFNKKLLDEDDDPERRTAGSSIIDRPVTKIYPGDELNFSEAEIEAMLNKRFPYYTALPYELQIRFISRLRKFMQDKVFKIHDRTAFREMPVLISAAAVQLTFGLDKYLLPHFEFIHVYPQEFMRIDQHISLLEGNVKGHAVNLSWKHFLDGYAIPDDGQNVGLHELAHALYYQTFVVEDNIDKKFRDRYTDYVNDANKAYQTEKTSAGGQYSDYAVTNYQEFWAESVELFFEKPLALHTDYPELYENLKLLLNQDPLNNQALLIR